VVALALTLRWLGVVETPGTGAGVETAGVGAGVGMGIEMARNSAGVETAGRQLDSADIATAGGERSRCKTALALGAGDSDGVATDATGIGIETVGSGAICTEGDRSQHHKHWGRVALVVIVVIDDGMSACSSSTPGLRVTVLALFSETGAGCSGCWCQNG